MTITQPSVYVVQAGHSPYSVLVFPKTAKGDTPPTAEIPGTLVSLDGAGNIYVLDPSGSCIVEYPALTSGTPARSLQVGPGTKVSEVKDMAVSQTGEIFVSDGKGIAVFSATANGNADPLRYILGVTQASAAITPGNIAVDNQDNLYVSNAVDSSVAVFGPTDTGTVIPARTITGKLSGSGAHFNLGMATDPSGNLYVLCVCALGEGSGTNAFITFEFGPKANGTDPPIRWVTSPAMYPWSGGPGIAVDPAGVIYITAGPPIGGAQTIFEFSPQDSGNITPVNTVTSVAIWTDTLVSHIAVQ